MLVLVYFPPPVIAQSPLVLLMYPLGNVTLSPWCMQSPSPWRGGGVTLVPWVITSTCLCSIQIPRPGPGPTESGSEGEAQSWCSESAPAQRATRPGRHGLRLTRVPRLSRKNARSNWSPWDRPSHAQLPRVSPLPFVITSFPCLVTHSLHLT